MSLPHRPSPHGWAALSAAALLGLACVALLLAGSRASAAPPPTILPPPPPPPPPTTAQLTPTLCPLDVALVLDNSGSTEGDTICYDCWSKTSNDIFTYPYPANGTFRPISYTALMNYNLCVAASVPYVNGSYRYIIMEAELYARNYSDWHRSHRLAGQGYWAIQRGNTDDPRASSIDGAFATGGDRSAYVAHHPYWTYNQSSPPAALLGRFYTLANAQADAAPRLDYDFTPTWDGDAYIWIRAQRGGYQSFWVELVDGHFQRDANKIYWAVDSGVPIQNASALTCDHVYAYAGCYNPTISHDDFDCNSGSTACKNRWSWFRLGSVSVTSGTLHTLKLWAGSPGYAVDKIVITNNGSGVPAGLNDVLTANSNRGRPATMGSARGGAPAAQAGACDLCNPIYGLTVNPSDCTTPYYLVDQPTNNLDSDLFGDREPLRGMQETAKRFTQHLNPESDQVGVVGFDSYANEQAELACLRRQAILGDPSACYAGLSPISYTAALQSIENQTASGGTNIGEALRNGLEVLGYNVDNRYVADNLCDGSLNSACGRGYAARPVMILLNDGPPNAHTGDWCHSDPSLWPYNADPAFDCTMYYARKAREVGVTIYTIGMGNGVIPELLQAVADETGGAYYWAADPRHLDGVYEAILWSDAAACVPYGLSMAADGAQTGLPGQSLTYTHVLTNRSYYPVTASLTTIADPPGWPVSVSPASQALEPGQAVTVTAVVSVPPGSLAGDAGVVRLVAALEGNEAISATVVDTTTVAARESPPIYLPILLSGD